MPVCRHKNRFMYRIFNFTKKHFRNQSNNDYPVGMDTIPTISLSINNKACIKHIIVNEPISGKDGTIAMRSAFNQKKSEHEKF